MRNPYAEVRQSLAGLTDEQARGVLELAMQRLVFDGLIDMDAIVNTLNKEREGARYALERLADCKLARVQ